jgi:hypothetical protein
MSEQPKGFNINAIVKDYFSKIIVIFLGISISFWFDEWRAHRKAREMEQKMLLSLRSNLTQDTFMLGGTAKMGEDLIRGAHKLIAFKKDSEIIDSVSFFIDMACSYTGCLINQTTYEEIKQTNSTNLIQNDSLKQSILGHYTSLIPYAKEWCEIDKMHTMSHLIPEMSNYFPVVIDTFNLVSNAEKVNYLKTQKLKNLLLTNLAYKREAIKTLHFANARTKRLIANIDKVLENK